MASEENPRDFWELSRARYEQALAYVEAVLPCADDPGALNEMRIIRMVGLHRAPWWGAAVDPADSSVTVGVMMQNAFEAVGDYVDAPTAEGLKTRASHWFTRRYLPRWRQGQREYLEWLDTLGQARPPDAGQ